MKIYSFALIVLFLSCNDQAPLTNENAAQETTITKRYIDPHNGYSEAVSVEANGVKTIYFSGQVGVGETFEAQFRDAVQKLLQMLEKSGATFDDVVKYNTYIVDYSSDMLPAFRAVRKELLGDIDMPASTLVGVEALGLESWGVEIEAIAVIKAN
ncbi:RidA family protein [Croceitalea rosinachiae]|uniref:RidA family protein n=1 Tax=Croceitalea rosinachiae TaxID=3075596 RepID=A0ABU3A996_9FLAO|nr:RidA family protein [Croceitalea sp. F388]MDT0606107.1 RidA family protein [Croceitalea sp. F388]